MTQTGPDLSRRATLLGLGATGLTGATVTAATAQTAPSRPLAGKVAIVSGARNNMGRAFAIKMGEIGRAHV